MNFFARLHQCFRPHELAVNTYVWPVLQEKKHRGCASMGASIPDDINLASRQAGSHGVMATRQLHQPGGASASRPLGRHGVGCQSRHTAKTHRRGR